MTKIEVVTLAFAALNFATYGLWWNKPLDVQCPIRVCKKSVSNDEHGGGRESDGQDERDDEWWGLFKLTLAIVWNASTMHKRDMIELLRKLRSRTPPAMHPRIDDAINRAMDGGRWWSFAVGTATGIGLRPIGLPIGMLIDMGFGVQVNIGPNSKRVPTFYAGKLDNDENAAVRVVALVVATVFGAIHCIAWSFQFPTRAEQLLWHTCSAAITCVPVVTFTLRRIIRFILQGHGSLDGTLNVLYVIATVLYIPARVALLIEAFISLRSLPPRAYETVHWTSFFPHI
jgi:hypothetical protein